MANTVKIRNSSTAAATPSSLEAGELAINTADAKLFWEDSAGAIQTTYLLPSFDDLSSTSHASTHATGGSDAIAPSDIGAAPAASPTFTGDVTIPDKIIHSGDSNTAIRFPAADTFTIETGGQERVRVDSSGIQLTSANELNKFGLTPGNTVGVLDVDVSDAVTNTAFGLRLDGVYKLYMWANGNTYIGNGVPSAPSPKLTVDGDVRVEGDITVAAGSGSAGSYLPAVVFSGDPNTGIQQIGGADSFSIVTGGNERLRVDSSGNVGIGMTPATNVQLDLSTDGEFFARFYTSSSDIAGIRYQGRESTANALRYVDFFHDPDAQVYGFGGGLSSSQLPLSVGLSAAEIVINWSTGNVGIGAASPTAKLDINANTIRLRAAKTPASSSDTGNAGDICWDSSYLYICTATNTWRRIAHSTW